MSSFFFMVMTKRVIGLGNALADILTRIETDEILNELCFGRGTMNLVDRTVHRRILELTAGLDRTIISGGSAANTMRGLARLGMPSAYIGKIGKDHIGTFMRDEMTDYDLQPRLIESETPTGQCMVLISPDGERTMATFLGAAVELTDGEITDELLSGYDVLHTEGYLVQNHELIEGLLRKAKEAGMTVSLDMASYNVVGENLEFLQGLVRDYVDILFANEEEARVFTGLEPEEAVVRMGELTDIAVVKIGAEGSLIYSGGELFRVEAFPARVVDTTGAGDLYATGFLYGWCRGMSLARCGEIGSLVAAKGIEHVGPAFTEEGVEEIKKELARSK